MVHGQTPIAGFTCKVDSFILLGGGNQNCYVSFTDTSQNNPTTWDWTFCDGFQSIVQNPKRTFYNVGYYCGYLIATNISGSDTLDKQNYVRVTNTGCYCGSDSIVMSSYDSNIQNEKEKILIRNQQNSVIFKWPSNTSVTRLQLYDIKGQLLYEESKLDEECKIDKSILPKGVYIYTLMRESQILDSGKILID